MIRGCYVKKLLLRLRVAGQLEPAARRRVLHADAVQDALLTLVDEPLPAQDARRRHLQLHPRPQRPHTHAWRAHHPLRHSAHTTRHVGPDRGRYSGRGCCVYYGATCG